MQSTLLGVYFMALYTVSNSAIKVLTKLDYIVLSLGRPLIVPISTIKAHPAVEHSM